MTRDDLNPLRWRAILLGRAWKGLLRGGNGDLQRSAEHVLHDLRSFCHAEPWQTTFRKDPIEMARRVGRREVFERIRDFLNLDESEVQKLMEVDNGGFND